MQCVKHFTLLPSEQAGKPKKFAEVARTDEKSGAQEREEWHARIERAAQWLTLFFLFCSFMHPGFDSWCSPPFFYFEDFFF